MRAVAFLRVSSMGQFTSGDSPKEQLESLQLIKEKYKIDSFFHTFTFHESAGKELQPLDKIYDYCIDNQITHILLKNIDRFTRGGTRSYIRLTDKFKAIGVQIIDAEGVISHDMKDTMQKEDVSYSWSKYRPTEQQEIQLAQEAENERRKILTRTIAAEIRYHRLGYWIGAVNYGYKTVKEDTPHGKRKFLYPFEEEAKYIRMMFELKHEGKYSDNTIIKMVNDAGYRSRKITRYAKGYKSNGHKQLDLKQFYNYLRNPVYCLVRVMNRQRGVDSRNRPIFRLEKPVRIHGEHIISDELFNSVNDKYLKITEQNGKVELFKGRLPNSQLFKTSKSDNYPFKPYVLCPTCIKPLMASSPKGKLGVLYPQYHCNRTHKWYGIAQKDFNETIKQFVKKVKLTDETILRLKESYSRQWEGLRKQSMTNADLIQQQIDEKLKLQADLIEKVDMYHSPILIAKKEQEIDSLELEIVHLQNSRNKQEKVKTVSQDEISRFWYFLEHLEELVLNSKNPVQSAAFFGLIFEELPTYEQLKKPNARTLRLAFCFNLKRNEKVLVSGQGLEP